MAHREVSGGLLGRRSLLGAAVVLGVALLYVIVVPALNDRVQGERPLEAGVPHVVFDSYQITPEEGWELQSSNDLFVTLSKAGASLILTEPVPAEQTPEEAIEIAIEEFSGYSTVSWVVGDLVVFVTDGGDDGVSVVAHSPTTATESFVVSDGDANVTMVGASPDSVWVTVDDEIETMATSFRFVTGEDG
jgi:hypothetical protein